MHLLDFILGDAFMRNVYSLYDFGNWTAVPAPSGADDPPFMQLLAVSCRPTHGFMSRN